MMPAKVLALVLLLAAQTRCFVQQVSPHTKGSVSKLASVAESTELAQEKQKLFKLLQLEPLQDPVLADPTTKEPITMTRKSTTLVGTSNGKTRYELRSPSNTFVGYSDTYLNLLEPTTAVSSSSFNTTENSSPSNDDSFALYRNLVPLIPPPLRSALATAGLPMGNNYIPMRDLFTSPAVSFAYERGWRQGFVQAGFPGPDREADMAMEYFGTGKNNEMAVVVDMSCATGLFTRRFIVSGQFQRVLGCDYSSSMLQEARRRIEADPAVKEAAATRTRVDLVRLDVGQIPMQGNSVDALHAGAAMHCWPDLPAAASEIYRVLKPGGRYFATTFLSSYFGSLQRAEGGATGPSRQAFQYFGSVEQLRDLMEGGGFQREKITIEVLGNACVVIRCEK